MKKGIVMMLLLMNSIFVNSQVDIDTLKKSDSLSSFNLDEVMVFSRRLLSDYMGKPLSGIEGYLERIDAIDMINRGSYASEPFINGMATERSVVTIDGMRIYGACTDKMDPVTSYVEITNLEKASVHSSSSNSINGATIAGSLDLVRKRAGFGDKRFNGVVFGGIESNNFQKIGGTSLSYSRPKFYTDFDFTYRDADNYKAGNRKEVLYSQFTKFNSSVNLGFKMGSHHQIEATFIYDHALNVGYPALPMDVAYAKAFIGSIEYSRHHISDKIHEWKTKLYYNDVTHIMDDSKRPDVPIRMDMPGWSKTAGFYSMLEGMDKKNNLMWKFNISGHHNQSLAEMTMYPANPNEKSMFMLTWPGVNTNYIDAYGYIAILLSEYWNAEVNAAVGVHHNQLYDDFGYNSLLIFYPNLNQNKVRVLPRGSVNFKYNKYGKYNWEYNVGLAYGERAPSVSEGYGFYLFNSFDRYDYIGNPLMKNEKSVSFNTSASFVISKLTVKLSANYFYLMDYIIGKLDSNLYTMTIGASGVKVYEQLTNAHLFNGSLSLDYRFVKHWNWTNKVSYRRGVGNGGMNLPLIQPLSYSSGVSCSYGGFSALIEVNGAAQHSDFSPYFGESTVPAYAILNFSAAHKFVVKRHSITLKAGVENMFDTYYTTFADWNRIPRMGRNIFFNIIWGF